MTAILAVTWLALRVVERLMQHVGPILMGVLSRLLGLLLGALAGQSVLDGRRDAAL